MVYEGTSLELTNSKFTNLHSSYGPAIYLYKTPSASIQTSQFFNNSATEAGGAIYIKNGKFTIKSNTFKNNSASRTSKGGAVFTSVATTSLRDLLRNLVTNTNYQITDNTFESNSAGSGGAIYNEGEPVELSGNTMTSNIAYVFGSSV